MPDSWAVGPGYWNCWPLGPDSQTAGPLARVRCVLALWAGFANELASLSPPNVTFAAPVTYVNDFPTSSALADFNGDGNDDLVTANGSWNFNGGFADFSKVGVMLGNGFGGFTAPNYRDVPGMVGRFGLPAVAVADFNGDNRPDVFTTNRGGFNGGIGADRIVGNQEEDILIAGYTSYDNNDAAIGALMQEWTSSNSNATRIANVTGGTGLTLGYKLVGDDGASQTVFNDNDVDTLTGSQGIDWFFANHDGPGELDIITDKAANELWSDTDF